MSLEERLARVALSRLVEPGEPRVGNLLAELGASRLHRMLAEERDATGLLTDVAARLVALDPEAEIAAAKAKGLRFVIPSDDEWPSQLDDLAATEPLQGRGGVPVGLWVRGPVRLDELSGSVAVVGARSATTYGASVARDVGTALGGEGICVVSGAAFGIDQAAHRGALVGGGPTVAVLACGADRVYPAAHRELIEHLARHGAVVSEAAPGCAPMRVRFLSRNRIIAALSRATVVVEAAARSGALNTANWAGRLNRVVLGTPGPVTSAQSEGVHHLIRSGAATLVTNGPDVLESIGRPGEHLQLDPRGPTRVRDHLTGRQAQVLDAVPVATAASTSSIARTAGVGESEVAAALQHLHAQDLVTRGEGGWILGAAALD
ncbi:DNA-processing protein DprA [Nocardioides sp.]|uniref:DNA-processing protein DprA n=1 Tax=Nocardioides sp. TaxID=35761 RepID=UPI003D12916B